MDMPGAIHWRDASATEHAKSALSHRTPSIMTFYSFLADVIVVIHFAYVTFVVGGMLMILVGVLRRWRWVRNFYFRVLHFLAIALVAGESLWGIVCPLTDWESQLREKAGEAGQSGSFVGRWVHELIFIQAPEWAFTLVYCLFTTAVLATLILAPPRWPWKKAAAQSR